MLFSVRGFSTGLDLGLEDNVGAGPWGCKRGVGLVRLALRGGFHP